MSDEVETLTKVLDKTAQLIDGVPAEARTAPTPCSEWDVQRLLAHLVGWTGNFADRAEGNEPDPEPDATDPGTSPGGAFRANADRITAALSAPGSRADDAPDPALLIAEYIAHGWDLASATGQPVPYTDEEAEPGLGAIRDMLKPEYRGWGFEAEVSVPEDAGDLDRLLAFCGRDPGVRVGSRG